MSGRLVEHLKPLPINDPDRARLFLDDITDVCPAIADLLSTHKDAASVIATILLDTPYLRDLMVQAPERLLNLLESDPKGRMAEILKDLTSLSLDEMVEGDLMAALRRAKQEVALLTAICDLGDLWNVETVTAYLTDFADCAVRSAIKFAALKEEKRQKVNFDYVPDSGQPVGVIVLAMGKHGARELNYSSDIDLIVFYDFAKIKAEDVHDIQPALVRCVQTMVKLLQERTELGYVFRTDLRLRPDPGSTGVAITTEAALHYYEGFGQNWERAAFIKARPIAGDFECAEAFLQDLSPFVWRKYMDFATIRDVHAMKRQTHLHKGHGSIALKGHNVKLGRGGIREIEFFVQTQQLIAGGRNTWLRHRQTVKVLALLSKEGWIKRNVADELTEDYEFLRSVEHRVQMQRDEQTHLLPTDNENFAAIARLCGFRDVADFENKLLTTFTRVSRHYARLFEEEENLGLEEGPLVFTGDDDDPDTLDTLTKLGFDRVSQVSSIVRNWHKGRYRATRASRTRELLTQMKPKLLKAFAGAAEPTDALFAFDDFLKSLPAGVQLFSLLNANPHLFQLLVLILGSAPRLSETIARYPHVFDALLEPAFFGQTPQKADFEEQLKITFELATDYQDLLDRVRIFSQEQKFLIGARLLSGSIDVEESQRLYSDLADVIMDNLLQEVIKELSTRHGIIPGGDVTILAMGKLGGREMSPTSDLDLILIYRAGGDVSASNGSRPLDVGQYYTRLTQRFVAALSAPTGTGVAYEVDLRLRPSGRAGPLATEIGAFDHYQKDNAWTWEHMALTRARPVGGSDALRSDVSKIIHDVLAVKRDPKKIAEDISEMNDRLHAAKEAENIWDIKSSEGGMTDVEFIAQFMVLIHAVDTPELLETNTGNALAVLAKNDANHIADIKALQEAHNLYSAIMQVVRLCLGDRFDPERLSSDLMHRLCGFADVPDFNRLEAKLTETQRTVRETFIKSLGRSDGED